MEVYVLEITEGINYEFECTHVEGVFSTLKEAKRQANRYLSIADEDGDAQFDINNDKTCIVYYKPRCADHGCINIKKFILDEELDLQKEFDC